MKNNIWIVPFLGIILMGLSTWVLITLVELQSLVAMLQQALGMDKVIGRIYAHMDRLMDKWIWSILITGVGIYAYFAIDKFADDVNPYNWTDRDSNDR